MIHRDIIDQSYCPGNNIILDIALWLGQYCDTADYSTVSGTWPSAQTQTPLVLQQWEYKPVITPYASVVWSNALVCNHIQH